MESELLARQEFQGFFDVLLDQYSKHDPEDKLADLYWRALEPIAPKHEEFLAAMTQSLDQPPPKMPSPHDIKGLIRQLRLEALAKLPAARDSPKPVNISEFRQHRILMLRGIYNHQGDTVFYRAMLSGKSGIYANVGTQTLIDSGLTLEDLKVTHQDVTGIPEVERLIESDSPSERLRQRLTVPRFQPDRRFMSDMAKQILAGVPE